MRRGEEDPPHLRTLLTEDCIESAHLTLDDMASLLCQLLCEIPR